MKVFIRFIVFVTIISPLSLFLFFNNQYANAEYYSNFFTDTPPIQVKVLDVNNIAASFTSTGTFDNQFYSIPNYPGFEWPKGSQKYAVFTAGLCIVCYMDTSTQPGVKKIVMNQAMASYIGEFGLGYSRNGVFYYDSRFRIYKVTRGDNAQSNPDWAEWSNMVPFGAPFVDVNNNKIYDAQIDTPGVRNADQTIFMCITDANQDQHSPGEGFGGGTQPIGAEVHLTAWAYNHSFLKDVQFMKWSIINKSKCRWENIYTSIVSDPDIGDAGDDYIGCDTSRNLGYCYNADNYDPIYGNNPPAFGFLILRGVENRDFTPIRRYKMTSFTQFIGTGASPPPCESDPNGEPYPAFLMIKGFKKDSTSWMDVSELPYKRTRTIYSGDPETNTGWTMYKGYMNNCNRDTTGTVYPVCSPFDMRFCMSSGADSIVTIPGDSQQFIAAQLITQGNSNLNSVSKLKALSDSVKNFYNLYILDTNDYRPIIPTTYFLFQNYPNPFNPGTTIKYQIPEVINVSIKVYDIRGRFITEIVNSIQQPGTYEIKWNGTGYASGIYFYRIKAGNFTETKKMVLVK
jgi:hypothetical protein